MRSVGKIIAISVAFIGLSMPSALAGPSAAVNPDPLAKPSDDVVVLDVGGDKSGKTTLVVNVDSLSQKDQSLALKELKKVATDSSAKLVTAKEASQEQSNYTSSLPAVGGGGSGSGLGRLVAAYPSRTIYCNQEKLYTDSNLSMRLRNNCPYYNSVTWSYTITPAVRSIITSAVNERGMDWWYNGKKMSRNAPHNGYSKYYLFHGLLNPATSPATVRISDYLTFSVRIGGKTLPASIYTCMTLNIKR